jgi:phasin
MMADPNLNNLLPPQMRAFAEQGVQNAQRAFDQFMTATQHAMSAFEGQATSARPGVRGLHHQVLEFSQRNIAASFDFAQKLLHAKDADEVVRLHGDFVKAQIAAMTEQAQELTSQAGAAASKTRRNA